jgi:tetratricopeptide (TPR) repeat protein
MKFIAISLLITLGFFVYSNSLNNQFVWDDHILIENNVYLRSLAGLAHLFKENIASGGGEKFNSYRPLQMLSYGWDYFFWRLDVRGYHLANIAYHLLAVICLYWLIFILFGDLLLAFACAALFITHPIHSEAVTYISGRADAQAAAAMLLVFIFYLKFLNSPRARYLALMLVGYTGGLLFRENILCLPLLLLLYHCAFRKKINLPAFLCVLGPALLYILFRLTLLKGLMKNIVKTGTFLERIPGALVALVKYLELLLLPLGLHMEYGQKVFAITHPLALSGIALLFILGWYLARGQRKGIIFFSLGWFLVTLMPSLNLYPINAYMAEHWLYLPSVGFFLILAKGLVNLYRRGNLKRLAIIFFCLLIAFYAYLTLRQNTYWKDPLTLYKRTMQYAPDSARSYLSLAEVYSVQGKVEEAIALLEKVLSINPNHAYCYNNLGVQYQKAGRISEAMDAYQQALILDPNYFGTYVNLGNFYQDIGLNEDAVSCYQKALTLNPHAVQAYHNLGVAYQALGKNEEARAMFKQALLLNPDYLNK